MNEQWLRTFLAVAETLNFTEAAKRLNLSQPAVSHQIHSLESYYQTPLFQRDKRKVTLTEAGQLLTKHASDLIDHHEKVANLLREMPAHSQIRLGCNYVIADRLLTQILSSFYVEHPDFLPDQLQITVGTVAEIVDRLGQGELDVAILEGASDTLPFQRKRIGESEAVLTISTSSLLATDPDVTLEKLAQQKWVVREPGCALRGVTEQVWDCVGIQPSPSQVFVFDNNQLIKEAVKNGLGLAVLPLSTIQSEVERGELSVLKLCARPFPRYIEIVRPNEEFGSPWEERFWKHATR